MEPKEVNVQNNLKKSVPHQVAFEWGSFRFIACITSLSQSYTLFTHEGVPVRAKVNVGFTQYADIEDYPPTNPTSGGGAVEQTWKVVAGDRLDSIAAEVYRDATQWRRIAERNKISNPLALRPGQVLRIPIG
jgi:nucleoid-associated protein YgaU